MGTLIDLRDYQPEVKKGKLSFFHPAVIHALRKGDIETFKMCRTVPEDFYKIYFDLEIGNTDANRKALALATQEWLNQVRDRA